MCHVHVPLFTSTLLIQVLPKENLSQGLGSRQPQEHLNIGGGEAPVRRGTPEQQTQQQVHSFTIGGRAAMDNPSAAGLRSGEDEDLESMDTSRCADCNFDLGVCRLFTYRKAVMRQSGLG